MPIPFSFIRKRVALSWRDALWGYERQMIGWSAIVDMAKAHPCSNPDAREFALSCLEKSETSRLGELLRELAASESEETQLMSTGKWLFLVLAWVFDNRDRLDDPLGEVEKIYADFDYPGEIENFVRYMPVRGDYDPGQHSKEDNENRLIENWKNYLEIARRDLGIVSKKEIPYGG